MTEHVHTDGLVRSERGSGTIMGVALVLVTLIMLSTAAVGGNVVVVRSQVRSIGDVVAVSAARSLQVTSSAAGGDPATGGTGACLTASKVASANGIRLESCSYRNGDVQVEVAGKTAVPFIPTVRGTSMAGPRECG